MSNIEYFAFKTSPCQQILLYITSLLRTRWAIYRTRLRNNGDKSKTQELKRKVEIYKKKCWKRTVSDYLANLKQHPIKWLLRSALFTNSLQPPTQTHNYRSRHLTNVAYTTKTSCLACFCFLVATPVQSVPPFICFKQAIYLCAHGIDSYFFI